MVHEQELEDSVGSPNPHERLVALIVTLNHNGLGKDALIELLNQFRSKMRKENREAHEDIVMEVMDLVVGWCHPTQRLDLKP
jgi:hypothetical protein